MEGRRAAR
ncbi:hypothetical protein E2C01_077472 [Portunus trituberculatus]|uniref:Uncharacterized protein n=1 Tax=Portunus trituberculatus TaxID=210409 RepID=A0A5B7IEI9_PORTR|nr:hypothetical protein [Portunus trituberculatus]